MSIYHLFFLFWNLVQQQNEEPLASLNNITGLPRHQTPNQVPFSARAKAFLIPLVEKVGPFLPSDIRINWWHVVVFIFIIWNSVIIPIELSFQDLWAAPLPYVIAIDYVGDLVFLIDIFINFRTTFMQHGLMHTDTKHIALHYLTTNFAYDLVSSIPIDIFFWNVWRHALCRIPKLLRWRRLPVKRNQNTKTMSRLLNTNSTS